MHWIFYSYAALGAGLLALLIPSSRVRRRVWAGANWVSASLLIVGAAWQALGANSPVSLSLRLATLPSMDFTLDSLRSLFLVIAAVVVAASIAFIQRDAALLSNRRERLLLGLATILCGSMYAVLLSASVLSLIFTWEVMSLTLWALIGFDFDKPEPVRAGFLTVALSEAGSLAAMAGLLVLAGVAGTGNLAEIAAAVPTLPTGAVWSAFLLTFFGFGVKAGILPVNVWIAPAYSAAPRSITPILSGATMNLGIFTLFIVDAPIAVHNTGPALVVLVIGALTAILGIVYALVERDVVRLLAQSSVENLGIVVAASGAGFAFAALGEPVPAGMALIAAVYHMMNHSAFKTLLLLGAGGIDSATGTCEMDRLGGLMRRLPVFGALFLVGTVAIAALPPFNGFVSEWLTLESMLRVVEVASIPVRITFALSGAMLALTAGLALTCFTLLAGTTLLGLPRSREAQEVLPVPAGITVPMGVLAGVCLCLGVLATAIIPALGTLVAPLAGADAGPQLVPAFFGQAAELPAAVAADLTNIGARLGQGLPLRGLVVLHSGGAQTPVIFAMSTALSALVIGLILALVWLAARVLRSRRVTRNTVWDGGLTRLRPEMTYNATAFASPVRVLFNSLLRPAVAERIENLGAFSTSRVLETRMVHIVDRVTTQPLVTWANRLAEWIAGMHHGRITAYASYVVFMLAAALLVAAATLH